MNTKNAIILFTKAPMENFCKTRMMPHLSQNQVLDLQKLLITNTKNEVEKYIKKDESTDFFIFYTPEEGLREITNILCERIAKDKEEYKFVLQNGNDIFEKMENAFVHIFSKGYEKVVLVGSDIYDLTCQDFELAFSHLDKKDVVIGKTKDRGYYLIGMKKLNSVFRVHSQNVFEETVENIKKENLSFGYMKEKIDMDDIFDLEHIYNLDKDKENIIIDFIKREKLFDK